MRDRLAVTGMQAICSLGDNCQQIANRLARGDHGLTLHVFPESDDEPSARVGKVETDLKLELGPKGWRHHSPSGLMACLLARRLLQENEQPMRGADVPENLGLVLGYDHNLYSAEFMETIEERSLTRMNPAYFLTVSTNAVAAQVSIFLQIRGYSLTLTDGFLSGLQVFEAAAQSLEAGRAKLVLAGGVEELTPEKIRGLAAAWQDSGETEGVLLFGQPNVVPAGEGCALLRLEKESEAMSNDRLPRAFITGFGSGVNPGALGQNDPLAAGLAIRAALNMAQIPPEEVEAVFLSANGNAAQDQAEILALREVFGRRMPMTTALKGALGETFHAGGALAAAIAIACAEAGMFPPSLFLGKDNWVKNANLSSQARPWQARHALVLSLEQDYRANAIVLEFP